MKFWTSILLIQLTIAIAGAVVLLRRSSNFDSPVNPQIGKNTAFLENDLKLKHLSELSSIADQLESGNPTILDSKGTQKVKDWKKIYNSKRNEVETILNEAGAANAFLAQKRNEIFRIYSDYFKENAIPVSKIDKTIALLADREVAGIDAKLHGGKIGLLSSDGSETMNFEIDQEILELLGADAAKALADYRQSVPARNEFVSLAAHLRAISPKIEEATVNALKKVWITSTLSNRATGGKLTYDKARVATETSKILTPPEQAAVLRFISEK